MHVVVIQRENRSNPQRRGSSTQQATDHDAPAATQCQSQSQPVPASQPSQIRVSS